MFEPIYFDTRLGKLKNSKMSLQQVETL